MITSDLVTIAAGFPPNSKSVEEWAPKWYETVWLPPTIPIWPFWKLYEFSLGDDECVYVQVLFNPTGCMSYPHLINDHVLINRIFVLQWLNV